MRVSDKVRAGPRGSGRVRVVEFSYYLTFCHVANMLDEAPPHPSPSLELAQSCPWVGLTYGLGWVGPMDNSELADRIMAIISVGHA